MERLKNRRDFLRLAKGRKWITPGLIVQAAPRPPIGADRAAPRCLRVGFTVTKKVGNAVERNRVRRRLIASTRALLPQYGKCGVDYVVIGRRATLTRPYERLLDDLKGALIKLGHVQSRTTKA